MILIGIMSITAALVQPPEGDGPENRLMIVGNDELPLPAFEASDVAAMREGEMKLCRNPLLGAFQLGKQSPRPRLIAKR